MIKFLKEIILLIVCVIFSFGSSYPINLRNSFDDGKNIHMVEEFALERAPMISKSILDCDYEYISLMESIIKNYILLDLPINECSWNAFLNKVQNYIEHYLDRPKNFRKCFDRYSYRDDEMDFLKKFIRSFKGRGAIEYFVDKYKA